MTPIGHSDGNEWFTDGRSQACGAQLKENKRERVEPTQAIVPA
jgi:hypothetical protein